MRRTFVFALLPLGLLACGDSEPEAKDSDDPLFLSLEDLEALETPAAEDPVLSGPVEADFSDADQQGAQLEPASAAPSPVSAASALESLAAWHRGTVAERPSLLRGASSSIKGIRSLSRVWEGEAGTYRANLRTSTEGAFGEEFARYATAWVDKGTDGLGAALASGPVGSVAHLVWTDVLAEDAIANDDYRNAGVALSSLLTGMLDAGYARERVLELQPRIALVGRNANTFLPFEDYTVAAGDSYWLICREIRKQGLLVNQGWISDFNHKRNYSLRAGETLKIPQSKLSVFAWRGQRLMALFADGIPVRLYAVSMGQKGKPTPLGSFTLAICEKEPVYYPPGGSPVPYKNADNPLGERWMGFKEDTQYGLHGTNSEDTIGSYESGGCVRMHNADAIELFDILSPGIKVTISS
ncbi:MAG: L,D-transpeptidase family protein [Planctomycetota bacterium]|nr:L,D-transpeptidase family protein [Planctomycetota bacterium]